MSITLLNSFTSILAGFAIFSILGYIANNQNKDVDEVVTEGKWKVLKRASSCHLNHFFYNYLNNLIAWVVKLFRCYFNNRKRDGALFDNKNAFD